MPLHYFDCNCMVGPRPMKHPNARWSTEHLLEDLDSAEIAGALVTHASAYYYDPGYGNARLEDVVGKASGRLFGAWCILPLGQPDWYSDGDEMVQVMETADVHAVRLAPGGFSLHQDMMGPTFDVLQDHEILTMLAVGWAGGDIFGFFHNLLTRYPRLPLLLTDAAWHQQRHVHRLMDLHENLHLEFSSYQINRGWEQYVDHFGDERLLFGTGLMDKAAGAARCFLDYAQIPEASRERIAGGNLKRLLGGQGPSVCPDARSGDRILDEAREGVPLSISVLDAHGHALHEGGEGAGPRYLMHRGDAEGMLEVNAWCGIDRIALMSWNGPVCTDAVDGNDIVHRAMRRFPEQVIGAAVIDPTHMSEGEMESEIAKRYLQQGFVAMKPYVLMNLSYEDPGFDSWWEFGNDHKLYALMHVAWVTGGVAGVGRLAERFPEVSWLIAHSGMSWPMAVSVAECIRDHPNVFAEITYTAVTNGSIEYLCQEAGSDHVIFGSDAPMRDPRPQLGWVLWSRLPVDDRLKILGGNYQRILDRVIHS